MPFCVHAPEIEKFFCPSPREVRVVESGAGVFRYVLVRTMKVDPFTAARSS